jgi:hypothetical protein
MNAQLLLLGCVCAACIAVACFVAQAADDGKADAPAAAAASQPATAASTAPAKPRATQQAAAPEYVPFAVADANCRKLIDELMKAQNPQHSLAEDGNNMPPYLRLAILALGVKDQIPELRGADPMVTIAASFTHDIGGGGVPGEKAGPDKARALLTKMGMEAAFIDRVCAIVGNHHLSHPMVKGVDDTPELYIIVICDSHSWTARQQAELSDKAAMVEYLKAKIAGNFLKRAKFVAGPATQPS